MKKCLFILLTLSLFSIVLLFPHGGPVMAAPQSEAEDEGGEETETFSSSGYEFTVERGTLTMPDGVKLAVSYWMPKSKKPGEKFPIFFEMNGYRKDDLCYLSWDYPVGAYFARHGYVVAKVDLRGTGDSSGVIPEAEYSERELSDSVEIINQFANKEWSNGKVGMYGLSWGAFNSLMVARRKPPALKAIMIAHASDDLYYQDVHFIDGVMHTDVWEAMIDTYNALPDTGKYALTPEFFANRFDQPPWHIKWKENLSDGPFWRNESTRFHPAVDLPIYIIGGLLDGYRDTVVRLMNSPNKQIKADIGPWNHAWPHNGTPGPNYEWRKKALRWWDHWLKGINNGIMKEPRFMVFMRDGVPPSEEITTTPGEWRCGNWPLGGIKERRFYPGESRKLTASAPGNAKPYTLAYKAGAGTGIHGWWGETSGDMSFDDESSMVFDSEPLKEAVEIMGLPKVNLTVSADAPLYQWSVRLEDVWPDGQVSLVSGTLINPADRNSRLKQNPLVTGEKTRLTAEIHFTTWRFRPKHKMRLSIGNAQFPMAWPTPYKGATKLYPGADTSIDLPIVAKNTLTQACDLPKPEKEQWPPDASYAEENEGKSSKIDYNPETGAAVYSCGINQRMTIRNTKYHMQEKNTWKVNDKDPAHATYEAVTNYTIRPPGRELRLNVKFRMASDEKNFNLTTTRQLFEGKELVREKKWETTIPRKNQ
ncbi:MAG: CocE/NonD family hydrolase [Syntrophales bacterium]